MAPRTAGAKADSAPKEVRIEHDIVEMVLDHARYNSEPVTLILKDGREVCLNQNCDEEIDSVRSQAIDIIVNRIETIKFDDIAVIKR